jgi:hypothetical protein
MSDFLLILQGTDTNLVTVFHVETEAFRGSGLLPPPQQADPDGLKVFTTTAQILFKCPGWGPIVTSIRRFWVW